MSAAKRSAVGKRGRRAAQAHPRQPSKRNVEVYGRVRQSGQRQEEVAAELGLSQSRVSRICGQVEAWKRWCDARPGQASDSEEQRRGLREEVRRRNEQIFALVVKGLARDPFDRQLLKLAMRAIETQHALEEGLPPLARYAATPEGREVADLLRSLLPQMQGAACAPSSTSAAPPAAHGDAENYHMPHFMQAIAPQTSLATSAAPDRGNRTEETSCGQLSGRVEAAYAP